MSAKSLSPPRSALVILLASAAAAGLAGCKVDNRPLLAQGRPAYSSAAAPLDAAYAYAPGPLDLPYAQPAQIRPAADVYDGYALARRAYAYDRAAYQTPPDYGFRYGDVEPWAWQAAGDDLMFAEPIDDGYRSYYYEPGEAYPYFVRDRNMGYAFGDNGVLSAVFSAAGALLSSNLLYQNADVAGRYLARGYDLRQAYDAAPRFAVAEPLWTQRAPLLVREQEAWIEGLDRQPAWREYRQREPELPTFRFKRERVAAAGPPPWANGPPAHAVARGLRERGWQARADNAFDRAAPVFAREASREEAKAARREAKALAKAERHEMKDFAKAQHHEARQFARAEAVAPEFYGRGHEDHADKGGEGHGDGGKGHEGKGGGHGKH